MSVPENSLTIKEWFVFAEHLATTHTGIGHTPEAKHYVRGEFVDMNGAAFTDLLSPALIAEAPESDGLDASSNNLLVRRYLAWTIVKQLNGTNDPAELLDAELECEELALEVLARLRAERIHRGGGVFADVKMDSWEGSAMSPFLKAGWAGYRIMVPVLVNDSRLKHDPANWTDQPGAPLLRDLSGASCANLNHPTLGLTQQQRLVCILPGYDFSDDTTFNALTDQQEEDLEARFGGGGGPCDPVTIRTTDGLTEIDTAAAGTNYDLPQSHIKYTETDGISENTLDALDTQYQEGDDMLYPDVVIPARRVLNSDGNPANSARITLKDLVDGLGPTHAAIDGTVQLNGTTIGNVPANATKSFDVLNSADESVGSLDVDKWRVADAIVTRDGLPFGTVKAEGTIDVPSAPCDPELQLRLNGGRVFDQLDLACGLQEYDIILTTQAGAPIGEWDPVDGRIEVGHGQVQLQDSAANPIGSVVNVQPESTGNTITAPDAVVQLRDSANNPIGSPDSYRSNSSNNKTAPDGSVTIQNSVPTTLHTVSVRSNASATQAIADSVITLPDGSTVNNPAGVAFNVNSYRSGITYNFGRVFWTGQDVSYRNGDEGWMWLNGWFDYTRPALHLHHAEIATWDTLQANNVHGNTLRFTDRSGAAAATSGNRWVRDHSTGLEYYIFGTMPPLTTWNAAMDAAWAATIDGSDDLFIPPEDILKTITKDNQAKPLNYGPFLITLDVWTGTTDPSDTTQARRCVNGGGGGLFGRNPKSGNNGSYIFCRKFI